MNKNRLNIEDIIKKSLIDQKALQKEYHLFGKLVYVQEPFVGDIDVQNVIEEIEKTIPSYLFEEVDTVIVGTFPPVTVSNAVLELSTEVTASIEFIILWPLICTLAPPISTAAKPSIVDKLVFTGNCVIFLFDIRL